MVVELRCRHAGWLALHAGMAGSAQGILIPERPFDIEEVCRLIDARFARGKKFTVLAVAEGAVPAPWTMEFRHGGWDVYGHQQFGGIGTRPAAEVEHSRCR